jgi:hypothetical protein
MSEQKRKRGGQPGNCNALKNGSHSIFLHTGRKRLLSQAVGLYEIDQQILEVLQDIKIIKPALPAESVHVARDVTPGNPAL